MTARRPHVLTEQRMTRRSAVRADGVGAAAVLSSALMPGASAQEATPVAGQEGGALRPLLSDNPMWEAFGNRALVLAIDRGADFGECVTTVQRVGAGMHTEALARTLYDQRMFDWLDETLGVNA